jgi:small subunit ribosomal protein S3
MGQKIHPTGFRLAVTRNWGSRWFAAGSDFATMLNEDLKVREHLKKKLAHASVSRVVIERPAKNARITVFSARPGVVIGKKGGDIDKLRKELSGIASGEVHLNLVEVRKPEVDSKLVAEGVAQQLERRVAFRRAMKRSMQSAMRMGALGIRINVSGRLGGAEIARMEWYREGRVPLHTLRADVDYALVEAKTAYGIIGVKVWIFKGEIMEHDPMAQDKRAAETGDSRPRGERGDRPDRPRGDRPDRNDRPRRGRRGAPGADSDSAS